MRKNNCEVIRQELDELMLDETCTTSAVEHLKKCAACREFYQTQTKLRRMVGSLGTVAAPADFDFRLRARLANDSNGAFSYSSLIQRGFAVAAVLIVVAFGVVVVRNVVNQQKEVVADKSPTVQQELPKQVETKQSNTPALSGELTAKVPPSSPDGNRSERRAQIAPKIKRPLSTVDISSRGAEVIAAVDAVDSGATAVIPIDSSLHSLKFSLDDGRGNARTISVPTVRFGSQRMVPNGNQFAQKNIW
jgi:hypothetical protein